MEACGPLSDEGVVRLLDHNGERIHDEVYTPYANDISLEDLRGLWRDMALVRAFDAEATSLQRQGELGLWVPALGQEAAQIGSAHALKAQDYVFPSYREHGVAHKRGLYLGTLLKLFRGLDHGGWDPKDFNFHLYTLVIGSHTLHATGYAMAQTFDGNVATGDPDKDRAVIAYFGDGATAQGDTNEALIFAAVNNAPIVFFCQNNQFAISVPTTRQSKVAIAERGKGFGIPSVRVDGNDVLASYAVTKWALDHAREGNGPVFIEAFTYRMGAHTTSDDPTRYRDQAVENHWRERDPLARVEAYLRANDAIDDDFIAQVKDEGKALTAQVRTDVRAWERGPVEQVLDHVYAEENAIVEKERAWLKRYEASFVKGEQA